jgi:hypothetical protein
MPKHLLQLLCCVALTRAFGQNLCAQTRLVAGSTLGQATSFGFADGRGTNVRLYNPYDITMDANQTGFYFSEQQGCRIRYFNISNGVVNTIAGGATCGQVDGKGTSARLFSMNGLALDSRRNVLWTGQYYSTAPPASRPTTLRRIDLATMNVTSLPSSGVLTANTDGVGTNAAFSNTRGVAIDASSNTLYVSCFSAPCSLRAVNLTATPPITRTISGTGCVSADGVGTQIQFNAPSGLYFDASGGGAGALLVAESGGGRIRRVNLTSPGVLGASSTLWLNGAPVPNGWVRSLIVDPVSGTMFLPQFNNIVSVLYAVTPAGSNSSNLTVVAGNRLATVLSTVDGVGTAATFSGIISGAFHAPTSTIYLAEHVVHKLRAVALFNCTRSPTPAPTPSPSTTAAVTPSATTTASNTPTFSPTSTSTLSRGLSASDTGTGTQTPSATATDPPTASASTSAAPTPSGTPSTTAAPSGTSSGTAAATTTSSATLSVGASPSATSTSSLTTDTTPSSSGSVAAAPSPSPK